MHIYPKRQSVQELGGEVFKLVSYGATPEQWAEWLRVPLEHAAARGNLGLVNTLLQAGADGSAGWRGCGGRTLLHAAAVGGNPDVLTALLGAGAQPDVHVMSMYPPRLAVHVAAVCGHDEVARRLLQEPGADMRSLLLDAACRGHEQLVNDLLEGGAEPNIGGGESTPLHEAAGCGHGRIVSTLLLAGANKDALDERGASPLCAAAAGGDVPTVEILLAAGVDVHVRDPVYGLSAVDLAIVRGNTAALKTLLRHGVDVDSRLKDDAMTALHVAVQFNRVDAIDVLLEAGADVEARTTNGMTPLNYAAGKDSACREITLGLLKQGANVRARDNSGLTPLHHACRQESPDALVDLLIRWGADETAVSNCGVTPADVLADNRRCSREQVERVRLLLARAPADRAWRRRCWLVVLRSRASKGSGQSHDGRGSSSSDAAGSNAVDGDGDGEPKRPSASGSDGSQGAEHGGGGQPCGDDGGGGGGGGEVGADGGDLSCLVALLVGLGVEGVFRTVVGFL